MRPRSIDYSQHRSPSGNRLEPCDAGVSLEHQLNTTKRKNEMEFNNNETYILLELLHTAINGLLEDLDHEGLSEQGATVLSRRYHDLHRIKRIIEEK